MMKLKTGITTLWQQIFMLFVILLTTAPVARAQDPLATIISPAPKSSFKTAPVKLVVRIDRSALSLPRRVLLNEREITGGFAPVDNLACAIGPCDLTASVLPQDGLIRGLNKLRVEVGSRRSFSLSNTKPFIIKRTFKVEGPKADVGPDQRQKVGSAVQLDGSRSLSGTQTLSYKWTIVGQPAGSKAVLSNPSFPKPSFTPDINGTYVVQLTVNDGHLESEPVRVAIHAAPAEQLIPVTTSFINVNGDFSATFSIIVGSQTWTSERVGNVAFDGIHVVALNRQTLSLIDHATFVTGQGSSFTPIQNFFASLPPGTLVIVSSISTLGDHNLALGNLLQGYGATEEVNTALNGLSFSFIGIKGQSSGSGYQLGVFMSETVPTSGATQWNLPGYFTPDIHDNYAFIQADYVMFQTRNPDESLDSNINTITVDGKSYTSARRLSEN